MKSFPVVIFFSLLSCASAQKPAPSALVSRVESLREEGFRFLYSKDPLVKDPAKARQAFEKGAEFGDPVAMDHLGSFFALGEAGYPQDCPKAVEWFEKSARGGYPLALNNMAYVLATCPTAEHRNADKAEEALKVLFQTTPGFLATLDTYAAIQAAQGKYIQSNKTLDVVIDLSELVEANPQKIDELKKLRLQNHQKSRKRK